ncbi:hypothetical protein ACFX15_017305 [Malus domestica]
MEDNYKFSKASHYLGQDNVKQNQFMVPNKSFNHKNFTNQSLNIKALSMEDNNKFSKASHYLDQDSVKQNQFMVPNKSFTNKSFNSKASPIKLQLQSFTNKSFINRGQLQILKSFTLS